MSLYDLKDGDIAEIESVSDFRLNEMGIYKGMKFKVLKSGNPCIIWAGGPRFCIGRMYISVKRNL